MRVTDEEVVAALLEERTNAAAAHRLGMTERSLYLRINKGAVKEKLQKAQGQLLDQCISEMRTHLTRAAETIASVMEDTTVSPQVRLNAANMMQMNYLKLTERADIIVRIEALEEKM